MITSRGSRVPLALGLAVTAVGFLGMALLFDTTASAIVVGIVYGVLGLGIGLAGPPSSSSLMGSVPVARAGMGSASNDLQRDFGGALFQAVMGTLLAVEYTSYFTKAFAALPPQQAQQLSQQAAAAISQSFTGAEQVAKQFPQAQAQQLVAAAQQAFVDGKTAAILFAVLASLIGFVLVLLLYPNKQDEEATYAWVAGQQPLAQHAAKPEPEPDPSVRAAEPDPPPDATAFPALSCGRTRSISRAVACGLEPTATRTRHEQRRGAGGPGCWLATGGSSHPQDADQQLTCLAGGRNGGSTEPVRPEVERVDPGAGKSMTD